MRNSARLQSSAESALSGRARKVRLRRPYVMTRPLVGPLNPTSVDHATDTYDTVDWLAPNG